METKILVVDDNPKNVQVVANLLSEKGYIVEYALNGYDALELVASDNYDLVLLDIMMPGMDGFEVCKKIKQDARNNDLPVVFLTARTDTESLKKAFKYGGLDYVNKPFNVDELLARVKTHVELKASKDKLKEVNSWLEEKVKERTADLEKANKELLKLDKAKSKFLQIISHEIRTPLNGILGFLSILKDTSMDKYTRKFIDMLDLSAKRLEEFSIKALDVSILNTIGEKAINKRKENVEQIISKVINDLEGSWKTKGINISQTKKPENYFAEIDSQYFYKCIFNTIGNAIKHSPEKSTVTIDIRRSDNFQIIQIKDEGIGFDSTHNTNDFNLFENENHIDKNPGLDLFLSNQIIQAHGGTMEKGNNSDKGAFVKIIMPVD
jgi:two-component system sensor histidine kinase/response regulator